jgi:hypothetical protein
MTLAEYFEKARGVGVLATADDKGQVNAAIYGRPHFMDEQTLAFIASDRLTRANLKKNPSAIFLFKEDASYKGFRLYLTKLREEKNSPLIEKIRRNKHRVILPRNSAESKFLIYFQIRRILPLIGTGQ